MWKPELKIRKISTRETETEIFTYPYSHQILPFAPGTRCAQKVKESHLILVTQSDFNASEVCCSPQKFMSQKSDASDATH